MRSISTFAASRRTVNSLRALVRERISLDYSRAHLRVPPFQEISR
jgi:hypothetical protein